MIDLRACNELADSLYAEIKNYEKLEANQDQIIAEQKLQDINLKDQLNEQKSIIDLTDKQVKHKDRKIKFQKVIIDVLGAISIIELGDIVVKKYVP